MSDPIISPVLIGKVVRTLIDQRLKRVTAYLSPSLTVKASRRLFRQRIDSRSSTVDVVLTIGSPNYEERKFIKVAKAAQEPFPIKKLQLKRLPVK